MLKNKLFKYSILFPFLFFGLSATDIGFVAVDANSDGSGTTDHFKVFDESVDGTVSIAITNWDGSNGDILRFYLGVNYGQAFMNSGTQVLQTNNNKSTAKRRESSSSAYGQGYWRDFTTSLTWASDDFTIDNADLFSVTTYDNNSTYGSTVLTYRCVITPNGNGVYTFTLPVIDDIRYEGGDGTFETVQFVLYGLSGISAAAGDSSAWFTYKIEDNDLKPYYGFYDTSDESFDEGDATNVDNVHTGTTIHPLPHPTDGVVYVAGHNTFTYNWTITDGTTTSADYSSGSGSVDITEQFGGSNNNGVFSINTWEEYRDINLTLINDDIDEADTENFTITLSSTDSDGELKSGALEKTIIINDDPNDLPPYVKFTDASQFVDEQSSNSVVTVSLQLNGGSGFANPKVYVNLSGSSTASADASGGHQDHDMAGQWVTFDGAIGDTEQNLTFNIIADVYDEGIDNDNTVFETVIITLDGSNVSNLRVDNDAYGSTTHTIKIRDNDDTPTIAYSADNSVTAVSGSETVTSPTINVIISDGSGNITPSALPITLSVTNHTSSAGTAVIYTSDTAPWDYKINGTNGAVTNITVPAYSQTYSIPIEINNDSYYEGSSETVKFDVTSGDNSAGGTITHTYTINEDDAKPVLSFTNGSGTITSVETGGSDITGQVEVKLSAVTAKAVGFTYSITDVNAGSGDADYLNNSVDDDGDGATDEANEGDAAGTDFSIPASSGSIAAVTNINESSATATINFTHHVDNVDELDKYVELTVALAVGESDATLASDGTQKQLIKLQDDDASQQVSFSANSDLNNAEGSSETITVYKLTDSTTPTQTNGTTSSEFTIKTTIERGSSANEATDGDTDDDFDLSASDGTAISAGSSQVLTFGPSDASASISIAIENDELYEGGSSGTPEDIKFELSNLVNAVEGGNASMTYYIVDDEDKPIISFDTDASNSFPSGNESTVVGPSITVKQDRRSIFPSTINYSADPSGGTAEADDFTLEAGTAEIAALSTATTIPLQILPDTKYEDNETVIIALDAASVSSNTTASGSNMSHTYTITNDDDATKPTLGFSAVNKIGGSAAASSPEEEDGSVIITVSLSAITGVATSVTYTIASGSGASDADWSDGTTDYDGDGNTKIITWAEDEATIDKTIVVNLTDDNIREQNETITVTLSGVTGGAVDGSTMVHTITLQDSDNHPVMQFTQSTMDVNESDANITIPLTLTHDGINKQASDFGNAQLTWTIDGLSTATSHNSSTDYPNDITTATTGNIIINKGLTDGSIVIPINNDGIDEWNETVIINLSDPVNATASGNQSITVTINDETDIAPTINFTTIAAGSGSTETESANATINFTSYIQMSKKSGKDLWFSYKTEGASAGNANPSQDYTPLDGTFKISEGSLTPSVTVPLVILSDDIDESDQQTVKITIAVLGADQNDDNSSYEASTDAETAIDGSMVFTYTIEDDDPIPNAFFKNIDGVTDSESGEIEEGDSSKEITVALSSASERNVTLYFSDSGTGTATPGVGKDYTEITDYTPISTISGVIGGGATETSISVAVLEDEIHEENQTVILTLLSASAVDGNMGTVSYASAGGGSGVESVSTYTLLINDDEALPKVNFTDNNNVKDAETIAAEGTTARIFIELDRATEKTVIIPFTFADDPIVPAVGATSYGAYPVDFNYSAYPSSGSITINGDGTDVTPGQFFDIDIHTDLIDEWNERIIINLGAPTNAEEGTQAQHIIKITDVSDPPTIRFTNLLIDDGTDETTQAGADYNMKSIISLSVQSGKDLQFTYDTENAPGNAETGSDYVAIETASFTIDAGQTQTSDDLILNILSDNMDEDDKETVKVTLAVVGGDSTGNGAYTDATGTDVAISGDMVFVYNINDDDLPPVLKFNQSTATIDEGARHTVTIEFDDSGSNTILSEKSITASISVSTLGSDCGSDGGCASPGNDYTAIDDNTVKTISAGNTNITFDITPTDDDRYENPQDIVINIVGTTNSSISGGSQSYILTINDDVNDKPSVQFLNDEDTPEYADTDQILEGVGQYEVTVRLDKVSEKEVVIPYTIDFTSSTAIIASDDNNANSGAYPSDWSKWGATAGSSAMTFSVAGDGTQTGSGTLTIGSATASETSLQTETFLVTITTDNIDEDTESIYFSMGAPTNASKGSKNTFKLDILDDDDPVRYSFGTTATSNVPSSTGSEDATPSFRVYLLDPADQTAIKESGKTVTINWTMDLTGGDDDDSEAGDFDLPNDFGTGTTSSGVLTFSPRTSLDNSTRELFKDISTSEIDFNASDVTYELTESFSLALSTADATIAADPDLSGTSILHKYSITNKDAVPVIALTSATKSLYENPDDGAVSHEFEFKISDASPIKRSEVNINAYFKINSTTTDADSDADILDADGVYADGDLDYTYNSGKLPDNQVVTISGSAASPITALSSGTIAISSYNDAFDEAEETFQLGLYTYNDAQATTAGLGTGASNATAPDGPGSEDTGYDISTVTILTDERDVPTLAFYDPSNAVNYNSASVSEDTSSGNYTLTVRLSVPSAKEVTIPYTLTLDYTGDDKTARLGSSSDSDYPYDFRQWSGLTPSGTLSSNIIFIIYTSDRTKTNLF